MTTKRNVLLAAGLLASAVLTGTAWAHGNVVPQAVETKGLTPIKDAGVTLTAMAGQRSTRTAALPSTTRPWRSVPRPTTRTAPPAMAWRPSRGHRPDLRMLDAGEAGDEWFVERVRHGAVRDGRVYMPKMADYLSQEALWAVRTYLDSVRRGMTAMRLLAVLFSGLLLCCAAAQAQVRNYDAIIAAGELKVAVYKDFAPYSFEDHGQPRGVDVELAQALATALGVRLQLIWAPPGKSSTTICATTSGAAARCATSNWPT